VDISAHPVPRRACERSPKLTLGGPPGGMPPDRSGRRQWRP
jgi:hypothetical protein